MSRIFSFLLGAAAGAAASYRAETLAEEAREVAGVRGVKSLLHAPGRGPARG